MAPPNSQSSIPVDLHRKALTEPYVKLSLHTALHIPIMVSSLEPNVQTCWALFLLTLEAMFWL